MYGLVNDTIFQWCVAKVASFVFGYNMISLYQSPKRISQNCIKLREWMKIVSAASRSMTVVTLDSGFPARPAFLAALY